MSIQFWKDGGLMCTSVPIPLLTVKKERPLSAYVEPVLDSSRYFVVRAQTPDRRTVMIGFGFRNRTDAFDLTAALNDRIGRVQRLTEIDSGAAPKYVLTRSVWAACSALQAAPVSCIDPFCCRD
jgi:hypothetical protein